MHAKRLWKIWNWKSSFVRLTAILAGFASSRLWRAEGTKSVFFHWKHHQKDKTVDWQLWRSSKSGGFEELWIRIFWLFIFLIVFFKWIGVGRTFDGRIQAGSCGYVWVCKPWPSVTNRTNRDLVSFSACRNWTQENWWTACWTFLLK